jgi:hypothetical protein
MPDPVVIVTRHAPLHRSNITNCPSVLLSEDKLPWSHLSMPTPPPQVPGASIILWDDFWRCVSRLLTGASLEDALTGDSGSGTTTTNAAAGAAPMEVRQDAPDFQSLYVQRRWVRIPRGALIWVTEFYVAPRSFGAEVPWQGRSPRRCVG